MIDLNSRQSRLGRRISRALLHVGVVTLVVRALIPLGYMPGDISAGEFLVLCPTGMPVEVMQALHRGHHDHDADVVDIDQSCPIGTALQPAWIPPGEMPQVAIVVVPDSFTFYQETTYVGILTRRYNSRAPPLV